jgi:carotenoid cleavage dioxygenase
MHGSDSPQSPYLANGFAPLRIEHDIDEVRVEGTIPSGLAGTFYRIGPNPQFAPRGVYNPLLGDGMIHAFRIERGRAAYANRWVRTQQWRLEHAAGRALFATSGNPRDSDPSVTGTVTDGVANTNIVWHAGKLLALEEGHAPIEIEPQTLATVGPWTFGGTLPGNMTAHPKIDPLTGELVTFANFPGRDFTGRIAHYVADGGGRIKASGEVVGPFAALVHDFAITERFIVIMLCPLTVSIARARAGGPPVAWEPELGTRVALIPRRGTDREPRWLRGEPCMAWHTLNAFEEDGAICLDVCQQRAPAFPSAAGVVAPDADLRQQLTRWTLDLSRPHLIATERLCEVVCEYPRIDERVLGRRHRYAYFACAGGPGTGDLFHRGVAAFDYDARAMQTYHAGPRRAVSEPTFVPRSRAAPEGDGYLVTTIYDERLDASELAVFDAQEVAAGPIASARLEHRVPIGFHGLWRSRPG